MGTGQKLPGSVNDKENCIETAEGGREGGRGKVGRSSPSGPETGAGEEEAVPQEERADQLCSVSVSRKNHHQSQAGLTEHADLRMNMGPDPAAAYTMWPFSN